MLEAMCMDSVGWLTHRKKRNMFDRLVCLIAFLAAFQTALIEAGSAEESISNGTTPLHITREETAKKGKPIDLHCIVAPRGKGVKIVWTAEKNTINAEVNVNDDKYAYHQGDPRILTINNVGYGDRDWYTCTSTSAENVTSTIKIRLRVRDPLGAVWPVIGILVESLLLFVIIFVYEYTKAKPSDVTVKVSKSGGEMKLVQS
ncbi:basigin-like [Clytia hemisphaerica]|uniref:Ig-like domain-containing protein n=1 Tax=Clytia hemisphaerica TaxID=252671 RepID=A0A7M5XF54_9CNID